VAIGVAIANQRRSWLISTPTALLAYVRQRIAVAAYQYLNVAYQRGNVVSPASRDVTCCLAASAAANMAMYVSLRPPGVM